MHHPVYQFSDAKKARVLRGFVLLLALATSGVVQAATGMCTAHSPAHRVALIELYSSEGCSSCPPADNWLSQWRDAGASKSIVPLALHVDYWNRLGWTDRFSQHRFTERQESLTSLGGGNVSYTPEVFVSGRELRSWSQRDSFDSRIQKVTAEPAQADIAINLARSARHAADGFALDAQFKSGAVVKGALDAYVAVYENALTTQVRSGENLGATLHHERIVRQWIGPVSLVAGRARISQDIALAVDGASPGAYANAPAGKFGVVAFVEDASTGDVLQVAELAACP